jgi:cardiolipin synthase
MRFFLGLGAALAGLGYAVWRLFLRVDGIPADHPTTSITPGSALAFATGIVAQPSVSRADVALTFAPATVSSLKLMVEGRNFYPAILADIEAATESVHINQYGFKPGKIADWFVPVLEARAKAGVEVRLSVDGIGSAVNGISKPMFIRLAAAGVQIVVHDAAPPDRTGLYPDRPVDRRNDEIGRVDHRKMYLIDGRVAWIGGAGIEDHFENGKFHDLFVRVEGDVVRQMQALFFASWRYLGGPAPAGDLDRYFPAPKKKGTTPLTFLLNWPKIQLHVTAAAADLIGNAKATLDIINPYVGDPTFIDAIVAAANRGVAVRMVIPDAVHGNSTAWASLAYHYARLLGAGIDVWEYPSLVHAKAIVADDSVLVGTLNLDAWALYRNPEIALHVEDAAVAATFRTDLFDADIALSTAAVVPTDRMTLLKGRILNKFPSLL